MKKKLMFVLLVCSLFCACSHKRQINPEAIRLNNKAVALGFDSVFRHPDTANKNKMLRKAIVYLNRAIRIDSDYFMAYSNKFNFQTQLKLNDSALITGKQMIGLRPKLASARLMVGKLYEQMGDSTNARNCYSAALGIVDETLKTMDKKSLAYAQGEVGKGVDLVLLNEPVKGREIFKNIGDTTKDERLKEMARLFSTMSRHDFLFGQASSEDTVKR